MPARLELSVADLMRVRVVPTLGPLAETALAYSGLQPRAASTPAHGLARVIRQRATPSDRALASYLWLSPSVGFDLFTLGGRTADVPDGQASVLDARADLRDAEIELWAWMRAEARRRKVLAPAGTAAAGTEATLAGGDRDRWRRLLGRLEEGYGSWVRDAWPWIKDRLDAERDRLARQSGTGGLQALAAALGPGVAWSGSSLELPGSGITGTHTSVIELQGRGLSVVPSFFALEPMVYTPAAAAEPVLLVVPCASRELAFPSRRAAEPRGGELLGRTRAAVLGCVARSPRTTSELSAELGIALSGASQHAAALRRAGLITTVREGGRVRHSVTELGENLLGRL